MKPNDLELNLSVPIGSVKEKILTLFSKNQFFPTVIGKRKVLGKLEGNTFQISVETLMRNMMWRSILYGSLSETPNGTQLSGYFVWNPIGKLIAYLVGILLFGVFGGSLYRLSQSRGSLEEVLVTGLLLVFFLLFILLRPKREKDVKDILIELFKSDCC